MASQITCLHLGCGCKIFPTTQEEKWYNLDLFPPKIFDNGDKIIVEEDIRSIFQVFPEKMFDHIYSEFVFEHLTIEEIFDMVYQLDIVLKDSGFVTIKVPNFLHIIENYEKQCLDGEPSYSIFKGAQIRILSTEKEMEQKIGHKSIWTPSSGKALLEMDGFFSAAYQGTLPDVNGTMGYVLRKRGIKI